MKRKQPSETEADRVFNALQCWRAQCEGRYALPIGDVYEAFQRHSDVVEGVQWLSN